MAHAKRSRKYGDPAHQNGRKWRRLLAETLVLTLTRRARPIAGRKPADSLSGGIVNNKNSTFQDVGESNVEFYNPTDVPINLPIDWIGATGSLNTTVKSGETTQIYFGTQKAHLCSMSNGGAPSSCPVDSIIAQAGQSFKLEIDGVIEETV